MVELPEEVKAELRTIGREDIDQVFSRLSKAIKVWQHKQAELAKHEFELKKALAEMIADGGAVGRNKEERDAHAFTLFVEEYTEMNDLKVAEREAHVEVELCELDRKYLYYVLAFEGKFIGQQGG